MLMASVITLLVAAAGILAMAYRYITAVPPLDYHGEIMAGTEMSDGVLRVLGTLYKVMGGAFAALGVGIGLLALFGIAGDQLWAKLGVLGMAGIAGGFAYAVPRAVERDTGVRTPWRPAAALVGLCVLGVAMSLI